MYLNAKTQLWATLLLLALGPAGSVATAATQAPPAPSTHSAYTDDEVTRAANDFFKSGVESLGKVLGKVLKE